MTSSPSLIGNRTESGTLIRHQECLVGGDKPHAAADTAFTSCSIVRILKQLERVATAVLLADQLLRPAALPERVQNVVTPASTGFRRHRGKLVASQALDQRRSSDDQIILSNRHAAIVAHAADTCAKIGDGRSTLRQPSRVSRSPRPSGFLSAHSGGERSRSPASRLPSPI